MLSLYHPGDASRETSRVKSVPGQPTLNSQTRLLPTFCLGGSWQMAIDAWLLEQAQPALRLYRWQRPCLSLGYHQHRLAPHWLNLAQRGAIELVRRPTGGQAVLHGGDLTYALVWPNPPLNRLQAYAQTCGWLEKVFEQLQMPLRRGRQPATLAASSCFATSTAADLVHPDGSKRIGSAQVWRGGVLLQHGSIQVAPNQELWREVFGSAPPSLPDLKCTVDQLETVLLEQVDQALPLPPPVCRPLQACELAAITYRLAAYRLDSGSSPEASIPRTT